jgi:pyruvate formate lyase activating enzyme
VKLDTNGINFDSIRELLELKLIDYVSLDYKAYKDKFVKVTHSNKYEQFSKTLNLLINSDIDFEVRTTLHNDYLDENDINNIINDLVSRNYDKKYYIQNFIETTNNIANIKKSYKNFDKSKLLDSLEIVWR